MIVWNTRRVLTGAATRSEGRVVRLSGTIGATPRALADLDEAVIAMELGPRGPLVAAIAFAEQKLKRAKPALAAEPLTTLAARLGDAPMRILAPSPARSGWQGAHGLLARATAVGVALTPRPDGLLVRGTLLGAFDDPPTEALVRLSKTAVDVAESPLGHLLSLDRPVVPLATGGDRDALRAELVLDPAKVAAGLRAATSAQLTEIFGA